MRVKIVKSSSPNYWYANKIGNIIDVVLWTNEGKYLYRTFPYNLQDSYILREDFKILK